MYKIPYLYICFLFVFSSFIFAQKNVSTYTKDASVYSINAVRISQSSSVIPRAVVYNYGTAAQTFQVQLKIGNYYLSTRDINNLLPNNWFQVDFDTLHISENGYYDFVCYTMLSGDENTSNDTITRYITYGAWWKGSQAPISLFFASGDIYYDGDSTYAYAIGGVDTENSTVRYNFENNSWTTLEAVPYPVLRHTVSRVGNELYLIGGEEKDIYNPNVYDMICIYNIASNTWHTPSYKLPDKIMDASSAVYQDSLIYVITGPTLKNYLIYTKSKVIKNIGYCPYGHFSAVALLNNKLFYFGDGIYSADIDPAHPENINWVKKSNYSISVDGLCKVRAWGDKIIGTQKNVLFLYDPVTNSVTNLPTALGFATGGGEMSWVRDKNGQRDFLFAGYDGLYKFSEIEPVTAVDNESRISPYNYILSQNYPNPFNPATKIKFNLPVRSNVKIRVYDMLGREAAVLANNQYSAGEHEVSFNGAQLSSGVYVYRIEAAGINGKTFNAVKKMVLLK